ncbi:hypothetical protein Pr1d_50380 [Bythopirellula goksoeyrii]|uniref:Uncharacterized protein n=2 Tax=Bythopirellula goksoeyrii TaxID=1400387 RepID=A0A5B9QJ02_9BACT|nr:hypothetical protein Pr1d_50380 [Bythopirellula goksoeyrii]
MRRKCIGLSDDDCTESASHSDTKRHKKTPPDKGDVKWRRRESNENPDNRNGNAANDLGDSLTSVSTSGPRTGGTKRHPVALTESEDSSPTLDYIAERWPLLQPHIREAIITLIDCAKGC